MKIFKKRPYLFIILFLVVITTFVYCLFFKNFHNNLKISFLDVGQGDSIYVEAPNGKQILIDGGPDAKVLQSLSKVMPFADRSIDLLIITHADSDHIGGLPVIINNYQIGNILENGTDGESEDFFILKNKILDNKINEIIAKKGMKIILDDKRNIYLEILSPDQNISNLESNETSIVCRLVYGKESFMLMGDADIYIENLIAWGRSEGLINSDILKLGHHGSKSASSFLWLKRVSPKFAIISAGKNNRYGHPSKEVLDRLLKLNIPYLATYELGNINFESDGEKIIRK